MIKTSNKGFTMDDYLFACLLCGETMPKLTLAQVKIFGKPKCCDELMTKVPINNLHAVIKALDRLKINLEKELIKDFGCDQYLKVEE